MKVYMQEEQIQEMMERPVQKKKIGIVHLEMVRESRSLYGMARLSGPKEAAEIVAPLLKRADREIMAVLSLDGRLEPVALEIAAVGGLNCCRVEVANLFKHAILNNSASIICFHNHPSGDCEPSREDMALDQLYLWDGAGTGSAEIKLDLNSNGGEPLVVYDFRLICF